MASDKENKMQKREISKGCSKVMIKHHFEIEKKDKKTTVKQMNVIAEDDTQRTAHSLNTIKVINNTKVRIDM